MTWETARTCVYDIYVDGALVYVGCSRSPRRRFQSHRRSGRVPVTAVLKVVRWYDDHVAALAAEAKRIRTKKPSLNVAGFQGWDSRLPSSVRKRARLWAEWEAKCEYFAAMVREAERA